MADRMIGYEANHWVSSFGDNTVHLVLVLALAKFERFGNVCRWLEDVATAKLGPLLEALASAAHSQFPVELLVSRL